MLEGQFYLRLLLIAIMGITFVFTMAHLGKRNPKEESNEKHLVAKTLGGVFLFFSVIGGIIGIIFLSSVKFPTIMVEPPIHSNTIVRSPDVDLLWGYPTKVQLDVIVSITNAFMFLALAAYCFCFKRSASIWWKKILKVIYILILYTISYSVTDFHYFDKYEIVPLVILIVMISLCWINKKSPDVAIEEKAIKIEDNSLPIEINEISKTNQTDITKKKNKFSINVNMDKTIIYKILLMILIPAIIILYSSIPTYMCYYIEDWSYFTGALFLSIGLLFIYFLLKNFISKAICRKRENNKKGFIGWLAVSIVVGIIYCFSLIFPIVFIDDLKTEFKFIQTKNEFYEVIESESSQEKWDMIKIIMAMTKSRLNYSCEKTLDLMQEDAINELRKMAESGNVNAQFRLGVHYDGINWDTWEWGDVRDAERAAYWYLQAAEQGNGAAQINLSSLYEQGRGVEKNLHKALYWLLKAVENNEDLALRRLGDHYRDGLYPYISKDINKAKEYWKKAADLGNEDARKRLEKIYE